MEIIKGWNITQQQLDAFLAAVSGVIIVIMAVLLFYIVRFLEEKWDFFERTYSSTEAFGTKKHRSSRSQLLSEDDRLAEDESNHVEIV